MAESEEIIEPMEEMPEEEKILAEEEASNETANVTEEAAPLEETEATAEAAPQEPLIEPALIEDYHGITGSVYEAVMIAAQRARQIGRKQKKEIDAWTRSLESTMSSDPDEESPDQGVDHFHHPKPTVQALLELKNNKFKFTYPGESK